MGIKEILTKPIQLGSTVFSWSEPMLFRLRLRGDLWLRFVFIFAAWMAATGVLLVLFAINVDPPGIGLALSLGLVFGLGPSGLALLGLRRHASGRVKINKQGIHRSRMYVRLLGSWMEWEEWPYRAISRCVIVPGKAFGKRFSVVMLRVGSEWEVLAVPRTINLRELAEHLKKNEIAVKSGTSIPNEYLAPLAWPVTAAGSVLGLVILCVGLMIYHNKVADADPGNAKREIAKPDNLPDPGNLFFPPIREPQPENNPPADLFGNNPTKQNPIPQLPPKQVSVGTKTELVGGNGGSPFQHADSRSLPVLGLQYSFGTWAGKQRVGKLVPIYDRPAGNRSGEVILGREGYAVGALNVDAEDLVDAVQIVFMRLKPDESLDVNDSYMSDWFGIRSNNPPKSLSGNGTAVIGIHGRGAAVLDAIGLVVK